MKYGGYKTGIEMMLQGTRRENVIGPSRLGSEGGLIWQDGGVLATTGFW